MPEYEQVDVDLDPKDIRVDAYHPSGTNGQHVNKAPGVAHVAHLPAETVVAMQGQCSQQQNRKKAMQVLKSHVYDYHESQDHGKYDIKRKDVVGTGDRSEGIRAYNYPQNHVTGHRVSSTLNKLDRVMNDELDKIINALVFCY